MTTIKATCPRCGEVDLTAIDIRAVVYGSGSFYTFICPQCMKRVHKPGGAEVIELLKKGGVKPEIWRIDTRPKKSTPITEDELIEFGRVLESAPTGVDPFAPSG